MILAGVDLAWRGTNSSAVAVGRLRGTELSVLSIDTAVPGADRVFNQLVDIDGLIGIAIDAPLIIKNPSGQRSCETALGRIYGARKAACHAANVRLFPDADSVRLSERLVDCGFHHLRGDKWQIECYPHPAIIELFGLSERLLYKKGGVATQRKGQKMLLALIRSLIESSILRLNLDEVSQRILDDDSIDALKGKALKRNEDALDAVICLIIAALYSLGVSGELFGDAQTGYIWVPRVDIRPASNTNAVLSDVLAPNLKILFCGSAVGEASARKGAYYAGPGNSFWTALFESGLTPRQLEAEEYRLLRDYGYGLTDLAKLASGNDSLLVEEDFDCDGLTAKILEYQPRIVAFTSKRAAKEFVGRKVSYGLLDERIGDSMLFVLTSPSGAARGAWSLEPWRELARLAR